MRSDGSILQGAHTCKLDFALGVGSHTSQNRGVTDQKSDPLSAENRVFFNSKKSKILLEVIKRQYNSIYKSANFQKTGYKTSL